MLVGPEGDSAILEWADGEVKVHSGIRPHSDHDE